MQRKLTIIKTQGQVLKWEVFVNLRELGHFFSFCKSEVADCIKLQNEKPFWEGLLAWTQSSLLTQLALGLIQWSLKPRGEFLSNSVDVFVCLILCGDWKYFFKDSSCVYVVHLKRKYLTPESLRHHNKEHNSLYLWTFVITAWFKEILFNLGRRKGQ